LSASTSQTSGQIPSDGWRLFPSRNIPPNFNYGHVYFYLVESVASAANIIDTSDSDDDQYNTCDTVTAKPLKKGRNLLKSGFVENVQDNFDELKQDFFFVICPYIIYFTGRNFREEKLSRLRGFWPFSRK
jgi:hypothetical protein